MTGPVASDGLPPFDAYTAKLDRAALRPSVEVGARVPRRLVIELCASLGYDSHRVSAMHLEADVVTVTSVCPECIPDLTTGTIAVVVCPRCLTDYRPGSRSGWVGFVTTEHRIDQP